MKAYKFLADGRRGRFSDFRWPAAEAADPWVAAAEPIEECISGVHACTVDHLVEWIDDELWEIELQDVVEAHAATVLAGRARLLRRIDGWDAAAARAFAESCVQHIAARVESARPTDGDGSSGELAALAADCVLLAAGARPEELDVMSQDVKPSAAAIAANVGFVTAHVAGRVAAVTGGTYDDAFDDERARQRDWLRDRIER